MEERSSRPGDLVASPGRASSRGRLLLGILIVALIGAGAVVALSIFRAGPDPGRLVYLREGAFVVRDLETGAEEEVAAEWDGRSTPVLDVERERVAFADDGAVWALDLGSRERERVAGDADPLGFDPAGRLLVQRAFDGGRAELFLVVEGTEITAAPLGLGGTVYAPVWIDATRYAVKLRDRGGVGGRIHVIEVGSEGAASVFTFDGERPLAASPDATELLFSAERDGVARLMLMDLEDQRERAVVDGDFTSASVGRGGLIALAGRDAGAGLLIFRPGDGSVERLAPGAVSDLAWSADGSHVIGLVEEDVVLFPVDGSPGRTVADGASALLAVIE